MQFQMFHSEQSFTTKRQINPQELKHTKTKRKASNARSKHLTHDDILILKSESHDHGSSNADQYLSMSSRINLSFLDVLL